MWQLHRVEDGMYGAAASHKWRDDWLGTKGGRCASYIVYTQSNSHEVETLRSKQSACAMKTIMWRGLVGSTGGSLQKSHIRLKVGHVTKGLVGDSN